MKSRIQNLLLAALLASTTFSLHAQGTAFTYQGRLNLNETNATGLYNFGFSLFDTNTGGTAVAYPMYYPAIPVTNGLFQVKVDFGPGLFTGPDRWLEIAVSTNGPGINVPPYATYTTLTPRQQVTPSPYAIFANTASNLAGTLPAGQITGTIAPANIAPGTITTGMLTPGAMSMLGAPDGSPTNALQVDNNGLVGIGTSTPAAGLQITSGANITTLPIVFEVADGQYGWSNLNSPYATALNGSLLAVGAFNGLTIANITNSSYPVVQSQIFPSSGGYNDLRNVMGLAWAGSNLVAGAYGYAGSTPSAVFIISCTNPASPVKLAELRQGVGGWNYLDQTYGLAVAGNLLAIGSYGSNAVTLADISNPSAPVLKSTMVNGVNGFTNLNGVYSVALSHNLLAIGAIGSNAVTLVDVSNPTSPVKLVELVQGSGSYTNLSGVSSVAISETGNLLAIAASGSSAVTLVDVSNPASPVKLAELCDGAGGYALNGASSLAFSGSRLAIDNANASSGDFAVTLVDVSNPASPVLLATAIDGLSGADYLWQPTGISIAGTNVAVGGTGSSYQYGLSIFGIGSQTAGLESAGWVGIGTTHPTAALDVVGNVVVEKATLFGVSAQQIALGQHAGASGFGSLAAGYFANAAGNGAIALGSFAAASGAGSTAIGDYAKATGASSTALGSIVTASGASSTAMGYQADAVHDHTFVWSDGSITWPNFSSTTSNEFSICAQNGVHIQSDKGIHLHATNAPMIVRDFDLFASYAPSPKAGIGRWGMFMETNTLVAGIPGDDVSGKAFAVAKYNLSGVPATLMQVDQSGNVAISGSLTVTNTARVAGLLRSGSETGTSQAPTPSGLVVRRINSTASTAGQIVARTDNLTLERDGSNGGLLIRYPASPGYVTVSCAGVTTNGVAANFYTSLVNPAASGTVQIYSNAQGIGHFECTFGITFNSGQHLTQVTLTRFNNDNFWAGTLMSTYNQ